MAAGGIRAAGRHRPEAGVGEAARAVEDEAGEVAVAARDGAAALPQREEEVRHDAVQRVAHDGHVPRARPAGLAGRVPATAGDHGRPEPALVRDEREPEAGEEVLLQVPQTMVEVSNM